MLYCSAIKDFNGIENLLPINVSLFKYMYRMTIKLPVEVCETKKDDDNIKGLEEVCQFMVIQISFFFFFMKNFCNGNPYYSPYDMIPLMF